MMRETVLLAALGDHPAVVTGMVKALREIAGVSVDKLHVLYPQDTQKHIEAVGYPLIKEHLEGNCQVIPEPLGFPDANTTDRCMAFLQHVARILMQYQDPAAYQIILSLAGGRKSMAGLMAVTAQFFPAVEALYHLLPRSPEAGLRAFPSIERLFLEMTEAERQATLSPAIEDMVLVPVPYPGAVANADTLWRALKGDDGDDTLTLTPSAQTFYKQVLNPAAAPDHLDIWLSKNAYEHYQDLLGTSDGKAFLTCFQQIQSAERLRGGRHRPLGHLCHYKRRRTRQRPIIRTEPNPIELYPQRPVTKATVCALAIELPSGQYDITLEDMQTEDDLHPYKRLSELMPSKRTLVVPLGKSPMVATQTYELLLCSETEGCKQIPAVAVLYPQRSGPIRDGARLLRRQFERRGITFHDYPIKGLRDIDSEAACRAYVTTLLGVLRDLHVTYPEQPIALSLSGGRKGMSALTLFAAERAGLPHVYHTLITDIDLEAKVQDETSLEALKALPTDQDRADRLFLSAYPDAAFTLFTVPLIARYGTGEGVSGNAKA